MQAHDHTNICALIDPSISFRYNDMIVNVSARRDQTQHVHTLQLVIANLL